MLIKTTQPKLFSRTKWRQSAGNWQHGQLIECTSYKQHGPNANCTLVPCANGKQMPPPLASAPQLKLDHRQNPRSPNVPSTHCLYQVKLRRPEDPQAPGSQDSSSLLYWGLYLKFWLDKK